MSRKIKINQNYFRAGFEPSTFNNDRNTVDVVFSTGAHVKRVSFDGEFLEELSLKRGHVKLDRFKSGAPVLNNHGTAQGMFGGGGVRGLEDVIGVVENARLEKDSKGQSIGVATVRLSQREEIAGIVRDIKEGIIRNVSVGYRVNKFEEQKQRVNGLPVLRAIDWEPMELSFVGIPADSGAQARAEMPTNECELISEGENMPLENEEKISSTSTKGPEEKRNVQEEHDTIDVPQESEEMEESESEESTDEVESDAPDAETSEDEESQDADESEDSRSGSVETAMVNPETIRAEERQRQLDIRQAVSVATLDEVFANELCERSVNIDEARKLIFKKLEKRTNTKTINHRIEVKDMEQRELRRKAAVQGLLHRFDATKYKIDGAEREWVTDSLVQTARNILHHEGVSDAYKMKKTEVATRALHSSSDFSEILANTANKTLRDAYEGAPNTYEPFARQRSASDFKEISSIQLGNGGKLEKTLEHGEYKRTTIDEAAEKYQVEKYGLIIGRTWELLVNDDLDAFSRIPARLGIRAREKENEIFWNLVLANGLMAETGLALFNTGAHDNLASSGTVISVASLGVARSKMRTKLDLDGELMNLTPRYLVVPAALETVAEQFITNISPDQAGNVNPFSNRLQLIVEPRLDGNSTTAWYTMSDIGQVDMAEIARLDGRGPEIMTREGFEIDGFETKIRYVFGMKILDYRAFYKNPGA